MSELNSAGIKATLGAGALILNDYQLKIEAIEGGHRLTAIKGSETQTMDVRDGVDGRSAYQFAVASGYTGTEAEFSEALAEVMEITGAEAARQAAEQARATAEQGRVTAETARADAETARETAENGRADAEIQRQSDVAEAVGNANSAASAANSAAELADSAAESANTAAENANGIVENLCTPFEETGGIVTCSPVEGQPLGAVSRIDAVQAGEGDPSPENVRPIQGWDSVTLSHTNDGGAEKTYIAALPETVYGGTLDWGTGVLTVNRAIFTATSTNTFELLGDTVRCSVTLSKKAVTAKSGSAISNYLKERVNYAADEESFYTNQTQLLIKIKASRLSSSDNAGINAFLAENPLTVVYKLDTPTTIQLTPQQIAALPGRNTLYSNTGNTIVSGPISPPSQTAEIMERLAALEDADSGGGVKTVNGVAPDAQGNVAVKTAQADWNQSDATAADYVKNRPFYAVGGQEIVPRTGYYVSAGAGGTYNGSFKLPVSGQTYHVKFGDLETDKLAVKGVHGVRIGENPAEFIIEVISEEELYIETENGGEKVIEIIGPAVVQKIDTNFLPELPVAEEYKYGAVMLSELAGRTTPYSTYGEIFNDYDENVAGRTYSHAEGHATNASSSYQHVQGKYNIVDANNVYAHIVGNGTAEAKRSNAHTLDWSGNAWFAGTVEGTGMIVKSSTSGSSKRFKITVDDSGAISAAEI